MTRKECGLLAEQLRSRWDALTARLSRIRWASAADAPTVPPSAELGGDTIKYLGDLASESFKRQVELDESVWRSLPFFAATFAFVATIIGRSAEDVPALNSWAVYPLLTFLLLTASTGSLAWSLRWFWVVLKPREYEYPAPDEAIRRYAQDTLQYHVASGVAEEELDSKTARDMRLFMVDQYGSAAATNLAHNAAKLKARTKVLLFMLLAFVLAFACEATIFVYTHVVDATMAEGDPEDGPPIDPRTSDASPARRAAAAAGAAEVAAGTRGRELLGRELTSRDQEQAMSRKPPIAPPNSGAAPQRPAAPLPQVVMKDRGIVNEGKRQPPPENKHKHVD